MTGLRIPNRLRLQRDGRHIIGLLPFGTSPSPQEPLQVGEAASIAMLPDVMKQMLSPPVPILPAFGEEGLEVPR